MAGAGVALGAGMSMGKMFTDQIEEVTKPVEGKDPMDQLKKLKLLLDENIISQTEFDELKKSLLNNL